MSLQILGDIHSQVFTPPYLLGATHECGRQILMLLYRQRMLAWNLTVIWEREISSAVALFIHENSFCDLNVFIFDLYPLAPELFFLILADPLNKMWIIQESNMLELWNKLNFEEEKKTESIYHV